MLCLVRYFSLVTLRCNVENAHSWCIIRPVCSQLYFPDLRISKPCWKFIWKTKIRKNLSSSSIRVALTLRILEFRGTNPPNSFIVTERSRFLGPKAGENRCLQACAKILV